MAIVGEAYVIVRANTSSVERDIRNGFSGTSRVANDAGRTAGQRFNAAFKNSQKANVFGKFSDGLQGAVRGAEAARAKFHDLVRAGYLVGTALSGAVGGISSMIGGLAALVGAAGGAASALAAVGNVVTSLGLGLGVAKLALGGVGKAVGAITKPATGGGSSGGGSSGTKGKPGAAEKVTEEAQKAFARAMRSANESIAESEKDLAQVIEANRANLIDANNDVRDAQISLNDALEAGRNEIKQIGFEAEDAALSEQQAALTLNKARAALAAVQDLPPNSAARQAAELAYKEADLNLRKAKDASATLNAEQARLAKTGVSGTKVVADATAALAAAQAAKAGTVVDALRSQQEAEQALAKAQRDRAETQADGPTVTPATEGTGDFAPGASSGGGGGEDPFSGLNEAQINFAKFIASLKPKFDELKEIAANGFLPPLQQAIQNLVDRAFPTVAVGVGQIAAAMGEAVNSIVDAITSAKDLENLSAIFTSSSQQIKDLGIVVGNLFSILLTLLAASAPLAERFTGFLVTATTQFDTFLQGAKDDGSLGLFFQRAGDAAALFGEIFGNLFSGFGALITANLGPGSGGQLILDFFVNATSGLKDLDGTATGAGSLRQYFLDVAENAIPVLSLVGDILKVFLDLGANPAIGEAAATLGEGVPLLQEIVTTAADAAPQLAELTVKVLELITLFQDTGAIQIFFDTLSNITDFLIDMFEGEATANVMTFIGRIAAVGAAFGLVGKIGTFAFKGLVGSISLGSKIFGGVVTAAGTAGSAIVGTGKGLKEIGGIMKLAKADGDGLGTAFKVLKDSTNPLAKGVGNVGSAFTTVGSKAATGLKTAGSAIADGAKATAFLAKQQAIAAVSYTKVGAAALASKAKVAGQTAAMLASAAAHKAVAAGQKIAAVAQRALNLAMSLNPIGLIITAIGLLVAGFIYLYNNVKPFRDFINDLGKNIADGFAAAIDFVVDGFNFLIAPFQDFVDFIRKLFGIHSPSTFMADIGRFLIEGLVIGFQGLLEAVSGVWNAVAEFFVGLWDNISGIVKGAIDFLLDLFFTFHPLGIIISNWGGIVDFIVGLWETVSAAVSAGIQFVIDILLAVGTSIYNTWTTIWGGIAAFFSTVWDGIVLVVTTYIAIVSTTITVVVTAIQLAWNTVWQAIKDFFGLIWDGIVFVVTAYISTVQTTIKNVSDAISTTWNVVWQGIKDFFGKIWDGIVLVVTTYIAIVRNTIDKVVAAIKLIWERVWGGIKDFFGKIWDGIVLVVSTYIAIVRDTVDRVVNGIKGTWERIWGGIKDFFGRIWDGIVSKVQGIGQVFSDAFSGIGGFIERAFSGALAAVKGPINGIIEIVNRAIRSLNGLSVKIPDWVPVVGGQQFGLNLPTIPKLAKGGIAMPSPGGTLVNVAEAGRPERIEPLDDNGLSKRDIAMINRLAPGGAGISITINAAPGQSEAEIAEMVSREIAFKMRKGGL